jgi:mono/diheme cytochrome c family protein
MARELFQPILIASLALAAATSSQAQPAAATNPAHGKALYLADGCYQCHGVQGQGGGVYGPKLAPQPVGIAGFTRQLRNPRDAMPVYTARVLPDSDLADIYAYLQAIPKAKAVADIPLLNR